MDKDPLDSSPPQNIDAEASLLGSLLIDGEALTKVADTLQPDDFFDERHAAIFTAIQTLHDKRAPIDLLTLSEQLKSVKRLDSVGGASYLTELTNFVPTAAHVEEYAHIVADKAIRRRLIGVSQRHVRQDVTSLESILGDSFDRLDDLHRHKGGLRGIPTGLKELDKKLAGLQRSDLFVIASRPAMGKTTLMLNIALHVGARVKQGAVLIFSLEMSKEQLVDRLLAAEAGVDAWSLRPGGGLNDQDFGRISAAT